MVLMGFSDLWYGSRFGNDLLNIVYILPWTIFARSHIFTFDSVVPLFVSATGREVSWLVADEALQGLLRRLIVNIVGTHNWLSLGAVVISLWRAKFAWFEFRT